MTGNFKRSGCQNGLIAGQIPVRLQSGLYPSPLSLGKSLFSRRRQTSQNGTSAEMRGDLSGLRVNQDLACSPLIRFSYSWLRLRGGLLTDELKNLDLSSKSFDQFVEFFFNREVVPDEEQFDYFLTDLAGEHYDEAVPSSPAILVNHMTQLFREFGRIARKYSLAQVDQGVWGILGANLRLYELLFDASVPLPDCLECIRSMYYVYSEFVAQSDADPDPDLSGFWIWWDLVLHGFWTPPRPFVAGTHRGDVSKLDSESRVLLDVMFETLKRILDLPHTEAQRCALHGLGHLQHPEVRDTIQQYIDAKKSAFHLAWLEECRDGSVQ